MRITKIFSGAKGQRSGIFIEADDKNKYLIALTLLADLVSKLKGVKPAEIPDDPNPLALSKPEIDGARVIGTYNYQEFKLSDEDLAKLCKTVQYVGPLPMGEGD